MNLEILKKYKIKAKKSLWQNFLVNEKIVEDISEAIIVEWKNIVEVWPWYGALTEKLLDKKPKSLTLIELDRDMIQVLESRMKQGELKIEGVDFKIVNEDVLKFEPGPFPNPLLNKEGELKGVVYGYSVIANIPYYITSPILRHFLYDVKTTPEKMLILMQKDVGDKILKWVESEKWKVKSSVLSLFIAKKCYVREVLFVWKQNFVPAPKVESSVLLFEKHYLYKNINDEKFLDIIKKWFSSPRKKLIKNFITSWLDKEKINKLFKKLWIDENIRWEDLDIDVWIKIVENL